MTSIETIWSRWNDCAINSSHREMAATAANFILDQKPIYEQVGNVFKIPFYVIGAIHYRESSFSFTSHLANGDPLFDEQGNPLMTTHVPAGLGPFDSWVKGAIGAIENMHWGEGWHWDICNALQNVEIYNGEGYSSRGIPSPYVWAGTNQYEKGFYKSDGKFSEDAVDNRVGCAAIFVCLAKLGINLNAIAPA